MGLTLTSPGISCRGRFTRSWLALVRRARIPRTEVTHDDPEAARAHRDLGGRAPDSHGRRARRYAPTPRRLELERDRRGRRHGLDRRGLGRGDLDARAPAPGGELHEGRRLLSPERATVNRPFELEWMGGAPERLF